jgi:hypothetical protein
VAKIAIGLAGKGSGRNSFTIVPLLAICRIRY